MTRRRRQQRRQENRVPLAPAPANRPVDAPVGDIPDGTACHGEPPQITRLERCRLILEAVKETCVERIVDLAILLDMFWRGLRGGISLLNMVSFAALVVSTQLWLSASILENLVHLFIQSGIKFQFPFSNFNKFLIESKVDMASDFRLLVLSCVCIAYVNDLLMSNRHLKPEDRLKIYWNVFFAQIIMYACIPFMNSFADIMNVMLAILSCLRIAVEIVMFCTTSDVFVSLKFLLQALMFHFLFFSILGTYLTYFEANKFFDRHKRAPQQE